MSPASSRFNRILAAAGVGLIIAVCVSLMTEVRPSAAITRGDFPAFYTLAVLAHSGEGHRLYDLELQRQIQNAAWPGLGGTVLPAAYPAFLAGLLKPLALLSPTTARLVWVCCMLVCTVLGGRLLVRANPSLNGLWWQLVVGTLLFGPLFLGVSGGQIVGLSFLLYAALIVLNGRAGRRPELLFGAVTGMWMFKPHYALVIVAMLVFQRRWIALVSWSVFSALLWMLGAQVAGVRWVGEWFSFAQQFSQIDMATNSYQMTGFVPSLYSIAISGGPDALISARVWELLVVMCALLVPVAIGMLVRRTRGAVGERMKPLLAVGPLLLLCAPAVNFYDLSLGLVPLITLLHTRERRDLVLATALLVASQIFVMCKDYRVPGGAFLLALGIAGITGRQLSRSESLAS